MDIFLWLLIGLIAWFAISHMMGKPDFWKATRKNPDLAWEFFNSHPAWHVEIKPTNINVVGPFRVVNPINGMIVKIWCESSQIEVSQNQFMASINSK